MDIKDKAYKDYKNGMKYKDIAKKYGVSISAVKSWKSRHWIKKEVATFGTDIVATYNEVATKKPRGAPKDNKNAKGNKGGAPKGNKNNLKHGGYSQIFFDTLSSEEHEMINSMADNEEFLLLEQIRLYTVRERRIMLAIQKVKNEAGDQVIDSMLKIDFCGIAEKIETKTERTDSVILRLEAELTKISRAKNSCIDSLYKLKLEKEKIDLIKGKDEIETEDTSETDGDIYGN